MSTTNAWKHTDYLPLSKNRQTKSAAKFMVIIFFHHNDVIHQHDVLPNIIVNGEYYVSVLEILPQHISRKRRDLVENSTLHHNNARSRVDISVKQYPSKRSIKIMLYPSYSLDLAPCDFSLFPTLEKELHGHKV